MRVRAALAAPFVALLVLPLSAQAAGTQHGTLLANPLYARLRADTVQAADLPAPRPVCTDETGLTPVALLRRCGYLEADITIYPTVRRALAFYGPRWDGSALLGRILIDIGPIADAAPSATERRLAAHLRTLVVARLRTDPALAPYR